MKKLLGLGLLLLLTGCSRKLDSWVAICDGKQYRMEADSYTMGAGGCVTFTVYYRMGPTVGTLCGCNVVARVPDEKAKEASGAK